MGAEPVVAVAAAAAEGRCVMPARKQPQLVNAAHGDALEGGAILVVETPKLHEIPPANAARTEQGLALRKARGRPFEIGNTAASGRGPSLTRIAAEPDAPDERRRVLRKATSLRSKRVRELEVLTGGPVSSAVKVELVAWARATAWADYYDRAGDAAKAAVLAEKASGHGLKAIGIAEREAEGRARNTGPAAQLAAQQAEFQRRLLARQRGDNS